MTWETKLLQLMVGERPPVVDARDWAAIDHAARAHRLAPLLHQRTEALRIAAPAKMRRAWAFDYLRAQQRSHAIAVTVTQIAASFDAAAIRHAFLKGVHLAWGAYADQALRTMRDIDVLIDADHVIAARDLLCAEGFTPAPFGAKTDDDAMTAAKHLAPLIAPDTGITIELHHSLTDPVADLGCAARLQETQPMLAATRAACVGSTNVAVLRDEDMLLHIVYHTAYDHFFCNGPQVIADVAACATRLKVDWDYVWDHAEAQAMTAGTALVLGLVCRTAGLDIPIPANWAADAAMLDHATRVMMRDNYADRVARSVTDLARTASPAALVAAVRRKFSNQRVIAQNNAHLAAVGSSGNGDRTQISAIGDVARHLLRHHRRDAALRGLLKDG